LTSVNDKVHYTYLTRPTLDAIRSQMNTIHTVTSNDKTYYHFRLHSWIWRV